MIVWFPAELVKMVEKFKRSWLQTHAVGVSPRAWSHRACCIDRGIMIAERRWEWAPMLLFLPVSTCSRVTIHCSIVNSTTDRVGRLCVAKRGCDTWSESMDELDGC